MGRQNTSRRYRLPLLAGGAVATGWYLVEHPAALGAALAAVALALWIRWRMRVRARLERSTLGGLLALSPPEFESAVADLLSGTGYRHIRNNGGPADLGADIICRDPAGSFVVVQCKRHAPGISVGSAEIQRFMGTVTHHGADRGLFVTTSRFTEPARQLAVLHDIELIDGTSLARLARQINAPQAIG